MAGRRVASSLCRCAQQARLEVGLSRGWPPRIARGLAQLDVGSSHSENGSGNLEIVNELCAWRNHESKILLFGRQYRAVSCDQNPFFQDGLPQCLAVATNLENVLVSKLLAARCPSESTRHESTSAFFAHGILAWIGLSSGANAAGCSDSPEQSAAGDGRRQPTNQDRWIDARW